MKINKLMLGVIIIITVLIISGCSKGDEHSSPTNSAESEIQAENEIQYEADNEKIFHPLMKDIAGWEGQPPEGATLTMGSFKMITSARHYQKDKQTLDLVVVVGNDSLVAAKNELNSRLSAGGDGMTTEVKEINGYQSYLHYDKAAQEGSIGVNLFPANQKGALLTVSYEGITIAEAITIIKGLNLRQFEEAAKKL